MTIDSGCVCKDYALWLMLLTSSCLNQVIVRYHVFISASAPLGVYLINESPRVTADSVEAEFQITTPVAGVRCFLRSQFDRVWQSCKYILFAIVLS